MSDDPDAVLAALAPGPDTARDGEHRIDWGHFGWGCSCGAGRDWPLAPVNRGRAAANAHLRAVHRAARPKPGEEQSTVEIGGQVMTQAQFDAARYPLLTSDPGPTVSDGDELPPFAVLAAQETGRRMKAEGERDDLKAAVERLCDEAVERFRNTGIDDGASRIAVEVTDLRALLTPPDAGRAGGTGALSMAGAYIVVDAVLAALAPGPDEPVIDMGFMSLPAEIQDALTAGPDDWRLRYEAAQEELDETNRVIAARLLAASEDAPGPDTARDGEVREMRRRDPVDYVEAWFRLTIPERDTKAAAYVAMYVSRLTEDRDNATRERDDLKAAVERLCVEAEGHHSLDPTARYIHPNRLRALLTPPDAGRDVGEER